MFAHRQLTELCNQVKQYRDTNVFTLAQEAILGTLLLSRHTHLDGSTRKSSSLSWGCFAHLIEPNTVHFQLVVRVFKTELNKPCSRLVYKLKGCVYEFIVDSFGIVTPIIYGNFGTIIRRRFFNFNFFVLFSMSKTKFRRFMITDLVSAENWLINWDFLVILLHFFLLFILIRRTLICYDLLLRILNNLLLRNSLLLLLFFRDLAESKVVSTGSLYLCFSHWLGHSRIICAVPLLRHLLFSRAAGVNKTHQNVLINRYN